MTFRTSIKKYFCQLCITANWLLVLFSKVEKCMVFSLSCLCLDSQKWARESEEEKDAYYLQVITNRRIMKIMILCLNVFLFLWFNQVLHGK